MRASHGAAVGVLLAASLFVVPATGQSLLGGDDPLITLGPGEASEEGAVNAGIGGDDGNLVDANVFPSQDGEVVDVDVNTDDGLDANLRLLNQTVRGDLGVGGDDDLVSIDVGIGGDDGGAGNGGGNGTGTGNGNGGAGTPGGSGVSGTQAGAGAVGANCTGQDASGIIGVIEQANYSEQTPSSWQNSRGVEVVRVQFCQDIMARLRALADASNLGFLQGLVAQDALLNVALERSGKSASDVLAVAERNDMLTVYVR